MYIVWNDTNVISLKEHVGHFLYLLSSHTGEETLHCCFHFITVNALKKFHLPWKIYILNHCGSGLKSWESLFGINYKLEIKLMDKLVCMDFCTVPCSGIIKMYKDMCDSSPTYTTFFLILN